MKRYASHYIISQISEPKKYYVIEVENGNVMNTFPLINEIESVEWLPGVIEVVEVDNEKRAYHLYPFDFTSMKPVDETQRILLL